MFVWIFEQIKRPWSLVSDGDLWQHFALAVQAKSPRAVKVSWVKGHADEQHIKKGITDSYSKFGNDKSDANADEGVNVFGGNLIKAASYINGRHANYAELMFNVVKHIVESH